MLYFLCFVLVVQLVNGKDVYCDFNGKYCQGRKHVLCDTEPLSVNQSPQLTENVTSLRIESVLTPEALTSGSDTHSIQSMKVAHKMMQAPKDKETCESACYETDTIIPLEVSCLGTLTGPDVVCDTSAYGTNCIKYLEIQMIKHVDDILILQDYHIIIFYILLFGIFVLNISVCVIIKTLSRYY